MSKAIAVERQSTGSADADGHPSTPRSTNPKSPKNPTDVPRQSKLLPTRRPPLMIKPHGRLVSSRLTRQSHPDCRATVHDFIDRKSGRTQLLCFKGGAHHAPPC